MATVIKQIVAGSAVSLLTTELNSLANNSNGSAGSAVNNVASGTSNLDGYVRGTVELVLATYSGTPSAGTGVSLWFLRSIDGGSNYEDGSSSVTPARMADVVIPVRALASGPQRVIVPCWLPAGYWKPLLRNDGTGISFASSGNTVKVTAETDEGV